MRESTISVQLASIMRLNSAAIIVGDIRAAGFSARGTAHNQRGTKLQTGSWMDK